MTRPGVCPPNPLDGDNRPPAGLVPLYVGLVCLHLALVYRMSSHLDELVIAALFWLVLYRRIRGLGAVQDSLAERGNSRSDRWSQLLAGVIVACLLTHSFSFYWFDSSFTNLMPGLAVLAIGLLGAGRRLRLFYLELLFSSSFLIPKTLLTVWLNQGSGLLLQKLTAQAAAFVLYYIGLPVALQGIQIQLPQGQVHVELGCTAYPAVMALVQIWFLLMLLMPMGGGPTLKVGGITLIVTYLITVARVAYLAFIVDQPQLFEFWHGDPGQEIISTLLIMILGLTYYFTFLRQTEGCDQSEDPLIEGAGHYETL
ncbi:exosortase/archaeosortase family protein [Lyngbya confervoides]|uniref:Exosortase/archaeosortase family protein n=1 Tax=Lyngbya confervoides BDU141951 TaxID=1574623 RepID=A0ABD4SZ01_9CYAN|nr:exosortase/archaeosortase family protein [Lyngbya confervoides]MCM1981603.1 exosortase/archaeosortase family protein [Lyngbya confervoides BDU141951]